MATNSTVSILIVYTVICGAFLRFYQWLANFTSPSRRHRVYDIVRYN